MKTDPRHLFIVGASSLLFLTGCCGAHHATRWEYKVVPYAKPSPEGPAQWQKDQEAAINDLAKDGWILDGESDHVLYFKRPVR